MKYHQLSDLTAVTEAAFQKEFQNLRPLLQAEAGIQQQLARLDKQAQLVRQEALACEVYQITGTDVLWSGWESTARRNLNIELARLRAQKLAAMDALRKSFGRKQAVSELKNRLDDEQQRVRLNRQSQA